MRLDVHQNTFETRCFAAWVSVLRNQHVGFREVSHLRTLPDIVLDRPKGRHDAGVIVNVDQSAVFKAQKVEIAWMHEKSPPVRLTTVAVFVAVNNSVELTFTSDAGQENSEVGCLHKTSVPVGCFGIQKCALCDGVRKCGASRCRPQCGTRLAIVDVSSSSRPGITAIT